MPHYLIRPGEQFRDSDGTVKGGGEMIELDADMAKLHAGKVDPVPAATQDATPASAAE